MINIGESLTIFPILFYPFTNILVLILLGFGLTYLIIPKNFRSYILWLSPWTTIVTSIFYFVLMSLVGLSVNQTIIPFIIVFLTIDIYVLIKLKPILNINIKENLLLAFFVSLTLIFNLSPLITRDKMLTSISMGNNDIIAYTATADYLKDHSIAESHKTKVEKSVGVLLNEYSRWGTPIINSFFLTLLNLQGYQYTYISQAVLFSLFLPLVYLIFMILFGKSSILGLILTVVFTGFNINLLYMLYHDFFGQVLFWGIGTLLFIFFYHYFNLQKIKNNKFNRYDFILGITISVLYYSYHEPAIFMFAPLVIFLVMISLLQKDLFKYYFQALLRITIISIITGLIGIVNATITDFKQVFMVDIKAPIGWQLFRQKIPFANPFEAMGFWSIHNFEPMPLILAIILSLSTVLIFTIGIWKNRYKILTISYLLIFALFFYWTAFSQHNFFAYNRALTYALPFIIVIFSIGLTSLFEKQKYLWLFIIVILISLESWSAVNLNKKFIKEHLSVDKSYVSILGLKDKEIKEPIYSESLIKNHIIPWRRIWIDNFLYSKGVSTIPTIFDKDQFKNKIPDNSLVLISKPTPWFRPPQVLLKNIIWENEYYKLGRLCNSQECLMGRQEDLSIINVGRNEYEDSLLIDGWSVKEPESRWAVGKESTLRLVAKKEGYTKLVIEALALKEPQKLSVYIDDQFVGKQDVKAIWQTYEFKLRNIKAGVYNIKFVYANIYKPVDLGISQDARDLSVNFRKIML